MEVSGQLHVPAALAPGKQPPVPTDQEVGWAPEQVWTWWREKSQVPARTKRNICYSSGQCLLP